MRYTYEDYKEIDKYLPQARYVKDKNKYEAWYSEVFCEDNERNTLCCQMDNVIYTCHLYKDIFVLRCITLSALVFFMILLMILMQGIIHPFLVFFAFFELLSNQWEEIMVCKSITEENRKLVNIVKTQKDLILEDLPANLRILQDCIIYNRDHSLSSPKFLRDKYLKEGVEKVKVKNKKNVIKIKKNIQGNVLEEKREKISLPSFEFKIHTNIAKEVEAVAKEMAELRALEEKNGASKLDDE